jgi:Ca2+/Na+ antiporter
VVFVLAVVLAAVVLIDLGISPIPTLLLAIVVVVVYLYVLYKRYNVEVVPEADLRLFDDVDDLRILSSIYGLDCTGGEADLRARLTVFVRAHKDKAFVWVAPGGVARLAAALEVPTETIPKPVQPAPPKTLAERLVTETLAQTAPRAKTRLAMKKCPVCDAVTKDREDICAECGADLNLYAVLAESKVGKRLASRKVVGARRKLRHRGPTLGGGK